MPAEQRQYTFTLSVPSTASTTTVGTQFNLPVTYDALLITANLIGLTGGTLDVYLQDTWDGGTTWIDAAHFTQVTAGGTKKEVAALTLSSTLTAVGIGTLATPAVGLAAATMRSAPWAPILRIIAVSGSGTSGSAAVQTIFFGTTNY